MLHSRVLPFPHKERRENFSMRRHVQSGQSTRRIKFNRGLKDAWNRLRLEDTNLVRVSSSKSLHHVHPWEAREGERVRRGWRLQQHRQRNEGSAADSPKCSRRGYATRGQHADASEVLFTSCYSGRLLRRACNCLFSRFHPPIAAHLIMIPFAI